MAEAPVLLGRVQLTLAAALPADALTEVGRLGTTAMGTMAAEGDEGGLFPPPLRAITVKV